jgi:hypothetical protein
MKTMLETTVTATEIVTTLKLMMFATTIAGTTIVRTTVGQSDRRKCNVQRGWSTHRGRKEETEWIALKRSNVQSASTALDGTKAVLTPRRPREKAQSHGHNRQDYIDDDSNSAHVVCSVWISPSVVSRG